MKGYAIYVNGKLEMASKDGWGFEIIKMMAEADKKKVRVIRVNITPITDKMKKV